MTFMIEAKAARALDAPEIQSALERVGDVNTYDPDTMTEADEVSIIDYGVALKAGLDAMTAAEKELTQPFEQGLEGIREKFRRPKQQLKDAIALAKEKIKAYRAAASRRAMAEARARQDAAQAAAAAASATAGVSVPEASDAIAEPLAEAPRNKVVGGFGTATGRKVTKFEVVDAVSAMRAYPHLFTFNESAAKLELKAAQARDPAAQLEGIRSWVEQEVSFGRR